MFDLHHQYLRRDHVTRNAVDAIARQCSDGHINRAGASLLLFELGLDQTAVTRILPSHKMMEGARA